MVDTLQMQCLRDRLTDVNTRIDNLNTLLSHSNDVIANEIAASDRYWSVCSALLGILALVLGVYIAWCTHRMEKLKFSVEAKEQDVKRLKNLVDQTNEQIRNDIEGLYERLRREETKTLLKRLVEIPEDISNVLGLLFARSLDTSDFNLLKQAFEKLPASEVTKRLCYGQLFFQHFAGKSLQDENIRNLFISQFDSLVVCAFKNDIVKSTHDICMMLTGASDDLKMQVLPPYYKALKNSKFKDMMSLYDELKVVVTDEQWNTIVS